MQLVPPLLHRCTHTTPQVPFGSLTGPLMAFCITFYPAYGHSVSITPARRTEGLIPMGSPALMSSDLILHQWHVSDRQACALLTVVLHVYILCQAFDVFSGIRSWKCLVK